ncbi:hypothetical protein ACGF0D_22400 [Kitasatospora sp. NPDC048298]|uniref:hypothetical protein n=1 Tax=Kitasatospora sp. NPDC048298 TaxID=3364049 RepID=UPI00370F9763
MRRPSQPTARSCGALPAIAAGHDAYVAVDASGTFSQVKRETGLLRMQQAGVVVPDYAMLGWFRLDPPSNR